MADYSKLGYGNYENIQNALDNGTLDAKDLIVTADTSELIYIKDDKTKQVIRGKVLLFDTVEDAVTALNADPSAYAGQDVRVKNTEGKYEPYIVQGAAPDFTVEPAMQSAITGFTWQEF